MINPRQDIFGYYRVGEYETYNKFEASLEHGRTGRKLEWIFNDHVWSQINWHMEPPESLGELYRQRAQSLRDKYDYLVLWYSGGADSQNILDTFLDNDIKLDEVASLTTFSGTGDRNDRMNAEVYHVAIPTAEKAKQQQPWLRHTLVDYCQMVIKHFEQPSTKFDWVYQANNNVNPQSMCRPMYQTQSQKHWQDMFDQGKRVGFIWGVDKPHVKGINGNFFCHFQDQIDPVKHSWSQTLDRPWEFDEMFYWDPDHPYIVVKQAHVVKRYLQTLTDQSPEVELSYVTRPFGSYCAVSFENKLLYVHQRHLPRLLYPKWRPIPYQFKPNSLVFSFRDEYFFRMSDSEPAKQAWRIGIEHRWQQTPSSLKTDPVKLSSGFKHIRSKSYKFA